MRNSRWKLGSIQSKAISLIILATTLAPVGPAFASFGDGSPTIPNVSVFGQSIEQHRIDGASGAFTQKIPLDIPPGRNGLQPDVALQYNSQNTSDGIVGYSWSLSIPYIERLNKSGSQNLYATSSYYTSSIDGELAGVEFVTTASVVATTTATTSPTILDSLPLTFRQLEPSGTSYSTSYTVPAGGSNKLFVIVLGAGGTATPTFTLNGATGTMTQITGRIVHLNGKVSLHGRVPVKYEQGGEMETNTLPFCIESEITREERYQEKMRPCEYANPIYGVKFWLIDAKRFDAFAWAFSLGPNKRLEYIGQTDEIEIINEPISEEKKKKLEAIEAGTAEVLRQLGEEERTNEADFLAEFASSSNAATTRLDGVSG